MRTLSSIAFLVVMLIMTTGHMAAASESAPAPSGQPAISADEFCGKTPPASISCPETRLSTCECYLADDLEPASSPMAEAPRRSSDAPEYKAAVLKELPDYVCHQSPLAAHRLFLERPPR